MDSLLNFCRMLPPSYSGVGIWGIVVNNKSLNEEQYILMIQIMEKRIKGFVKANNIRFPVVLDRNRIFAMRFDPGSKVLVLDSERQLVLNYDFPLESQEIQHIQQILFLR